LGWFVVKFQKYYITLGTLHYIVVGYITRVECKERRLLLAKYHAEILHDWLNTMVGKSAKHKNLKRRNAADS
jgi:hypothetical protein